MTTENDFLTYDSNLLLQVRHLKMHFPIYSRGIIGKRITNYVRAVDDVNFVIRRGEVLGLVGESGCGKTTLGRCVVRAYKPTAGEIIYHEAENLTEDYKKLRVHVRHTAKSDAASIGHAIDFAKLHSSELRVYRREIQMIFQDPYSSLNPRMTLEQIVGEPLWNYRIMKGSELRDRVAELLKLVGLRPEYMSRYPHAFSGGQRQRIGVARALALNPQLVICDEPVSALDVSVQAQVLNLLQDLQQRLDLTYLFISHDLSVVRHISNRIAVMYVGKIVEIAATEDLFTDIQHPYTAALLSSAPTPDPRAKRLRVPLEGDVPDPANPPSGCYFHPRCRFATDLCSQEQPELREIKPDHWVSCHHSEELSFEA